MSAGIIYMLSNPSNNIYIGQTTSFRRRMNAYKNFHKIKNQKALKNSLKKYGFQNHNVSILRECDKIEMDFWECFYIKIFDSFENGLNSTSGGATPVKKKGYTISDDWKAKISQSHMGKIREPFSAEWRENISKSHIGIKRTDVWIKNLKEAARLRKENGGYVKNDEQMAKFKNSIKNYYATEDGLLLRNKLSIRTKNRFSIPVLQIYNGKVIAEYSSAREASKMVGIAHSHIINCCNNKVTSAGGYIWQKKNLNRER